MKIGDLITITQNHPYGWVNLYRTPTVQIENIETRFHCGGIGTIISISPDGISRAWLRVLCNEGVGWMLSFHVKVVQ